ncbi:MAG: hypothetical protein QG635_2476, partial [Bacteroidota bacterium]|nr:hypothetical protein [Bacteroidota bacterium]
GGVYVEYINSTKSALHFTVGGLIGGGSTSANGSGFDRGISESSPFFVIEPALSAEINMTRFVRIAAGASYRVILGADMDDDVFKSTDLSGPSVNLTFKFGWFDGFNLPGFFRHLHKDDDGKEEW